MSLPIRESHPPTPSSLFLAFGLPHLLLWAQVLVALAFPPGMGRVGASKQSFLVACHPLSENMVSGLLQLAVPLLPVPFELLTRLCSGISSEHAHACFLLSLSSWGSTFSQCLLLVPFALDASYCVFRANYWT